MEKMSEMMDGELDAQEARVQIRRLTQDATLAQQWETYHLIRDVLRNEVVIGPGLTRKVSAKLDHEPTVVAPHTRLPARLVRYSLPMAAAVAGITVVGWLALNIGPTVQPGSPRVAQTSSAQGQARTPLASAEPSAQSGAKLATGREYYLLAHREFSPTAAMQGVASLRTVSAGDADSRQ